jgi:hypothetical protein
MELESQLQSPTEYGYSKTLFKKKSITHGVEYGVVRTKGQDKVAYKEAYQRWCLLLTLWVCGYIDLYFCDESGFTLQPYIPYAWQKKRANHPSVRDRNKRHRLNVLGFMSLDNRLHVYHTEKSVDCCFCTTVP